MKKAVGYIRISTKDQSNFSLDGQEHYIRDFCKKQNLQLLNIYIDNGQSAKDFDRPDWKALESFVQINHKDVDSLIVVKYDRFSRNTSEALRKLELLESKFNIRVLSVMEPIMVHPHSPFFFQIRANILVGAQVEWMLIKERTKFGIRQAALSGRYINHAPYGYTNGKDERNKPVLIIDPFAANLVKEIFSLFLTGNPIEEIRSTVKEKGFKRSGRSIIHRILDQPAYAGLIKVPAYYDEPAKFVKGIHEAIIDEITWWKCQALLHGKPASKKCTFNENFPLRGSLKHSCSKIFTAAFAQGKKIKVGYYRCMKCNTSFNAQRLHERFDELLKALSLSEIQIRYLEESILMQMDRQIKMREQVIADKSGELSAANKKLDGIEEKFINNDLDAITYKKWRDRYYFEVAKLQSELCELRKPSSRAREEIKECLASLADLHHIYHKANLQQKHSFVNLVFDQSLTYQGEIFRTPYLLPMFASKALLLKEKRLLIYEQPEELSNHLQHCSPTDTIFEPLKRLLQVVALIKAA